MYAGQVGGQDWVGDDRSSDGGGDDDDDNGCYINNKFYLVSLILVVKQHRSELVSGFSGLRKTHLIVYVPCRKKTPNNNNNKIEYKLAERSNGEKSALAHFSIDPYRLDTFS